jgi:hypothetical protein
VRLARSPVHECKTSGQFQMSRSVTSRKRNEWSEAKREYARTLTLPLPVYGERSKRNEIDGAKPNGKQCVSWPKCRPSRRLGSEYAFSSEYERSKAKPCASTGGPLTLPLPGVLGEKQDKRTEWTEPKTLASYRMSPIVFTARCELDGPNPNEPIARLITRRWPITGTNRFVGISR